jgi:hypothetical protein
MEKRVLCESRCEGLWRARLVAHLRVLIDRAGRRRTSRAGAAILLGNAAERLLDVHASASLCVGSVREKAVSESRVCAEKRGVKNVVRAGTEGTARRAVETWWATARRVSRTHVGLPHLPHSVL